MPDRSPSAGAPGSSGRAGVPARTGPSAADRGQRGPTPRFNPHGAPPSVTPRRLVRLLASTADRLLAIAPGIVLPATALAAHLASRLGLYGVGPDLVSAVVPGLDRRASRRVASAAAASTAVSGRLTRAIRGGRGEIASRLLDPAGLAAFQRDVASVPRAVFVTFHLGPFSIIRTALEQTGARCLYLRMEPGGPASPGVEMVPEARPGGRERLLGEPHPARSGTDRAAGPAGGPGRLPIEEGSGPAPENGSASLDMGCDGDRMAAALWQARRWLDSGGVVVVLPDSGIGAPADPVRCLGRLITFSRGAFTLARLARAPLVPVRCRWAQSAAPGVLRKVACLVECWAPAIEPPEDVRDAGRAWEARAAQQLADRLESWIGRQPEALNLEWIGLLARAPRAEITTGPDRGDPSAR